MQDLEEHDFLTSLNNLNLPDFTDEFKDIPYSAIFDKDIFEFLAKPEIVQNINLYFEKYNLLLQQSKYFKKGLFSPAKSDSVAKALATENFFKANHVIRLNGDDVDIKTDDELSEKLNHERKEILENPELMKVESQIKKASVQRLRDLLEEHQIISELADLEKFKRNLWKSYLKTEESFIVDLLETYDNGRERMNEIEEISRTQRTSWDPVVEKFNSRFYVPFEIEISNRSGAVLGKSTPNVIFKFKNPSTGLFKNFKRTELDGIEVLSQGEKRALYPLNILFHVESKIQNNQRTFFIVDDIADSFDYKNKYAIIQYLKDISEVENFKQIILTHNFDFFELYKVEILQDISNACLQQNLMAKSNY